VSQLIFNLIEASCPVDESIDSLETLEFGHPGSNGDRGATSLGEEA